MPTLPIRALAAAVAEYETGKTADQSSKESKTNMILFVSIGGALLGGGALLIMILFLLKKCGGRIAKRIKKWRSGRPETPTHLQGADLAHWREHGYISGIQPRYQPAVQPNIRRAGPQNDPQGVAMDNLAAPPAAHTGRRPINFSGPEWDTVDLANGVSNPPNRPRYYAQPPRPVREGGYGGFGAPSTAAQPPRPIREGGYGGLGTPGTAL